MRIKLIINGILSFVVLLGFILFMVGELSEWPRPIVLSNLYFSGLVMFSSGCCLSFIMGVITLNSIDSAFEREWCIASEILGILGGLLGINIIVSFIGAFKEF